MGKSKGVVQKGLVVKSNVVVQTGLGEETMDVGKKTSCLLYFASCIETEHVLLFLFVSESI